MTVLYDGLGRPILRVQSTPYEGASFQSPRMFMWQVPSSGPVTSVRASLSTLRARSRALVRNNSIAAAAVDEWVSNLIGSGITPRWNVGDISLKESIQELWNRWVEEADADGIQDFYGLQMLVARELVEAGEVFVRLRYRRQRDGMTVPLQIQVLEPDLVDEAHSETLPNGNTIKSGIELNKVGKRVAYWMYETHPADFDFGGLSHEKKRVSAKLVAHVFRPLRAGQLRGVPWFAPVLVALRELDQYEDAELVRKKTAAMFGGFIIEGGEPLPQLGISKGADSYNRDIVALEPGSFPVLPPGADVKFSNPADVGSNYNVWIRNQLMRIAKGLGLTYEQLTGDLSEVNYSSIRAGLLEFRRQCRQIQHRIIAHQFCRFVARAWMDVAVLSGALQISDYWDNPEKYKSITWHPDGWEWVDPVKDITAEIKAVRAGFKSRAQVVSERGRDIEQIDREQAEDAQRAHSLGLIYDTDPRKVNKA